MFGVMGLSVEGAVRATCVERLESRLAHTDWCMENGEYVTQAVVNRTVIAD